MASGTQEKRAAVDDLYRVEGKAELIGGRIVRLMPTGSRPNEVAGEAFFSLKVHVRATGRGRGYTDYAGFVVPKLSSGRQSFSPDAAYHEGPQAADAMKFLPGSPNLAVEVRSKTDYGDAAEAELAARRADTFEAGTRVVRDVDPRDECVRADRPDVPERPVVFRKSQVADAGPAVLGWRMAVDDIFI